MKKILYIVLDGLGDRPSPDLGNKTPLEAADTPNMDRLAQKGVCGLVHTVGEKIAPESDVAVICILGYDAQKYYTGRGPLESYAEGLEVKNGDLAYRVNFATMDENKNLIDRRVGRNLTSEEAQALAREVNEKVKLTSYPATFKFKSTIGHRGVLVIYPLKGKLSAQVTNSDPAYEKEGVFGVAKATFENVLLEVKPVSGFEKSPEAIAAAALTNEFIQKSNQVLNESLLNKKRISEKKMPGNVILTRDAGDKLPKFPPLKELYGLNFGSFVEMPVEKGIAILTGMEVVSLPLPAGEASVDFPLRAKLAKKELSRFDGLYIHLKGPDEPAHDGDCRKKKESIEAIDKFFFSELLKDLDLKNTIIAVTADHSTPCSMKAHSADSVPLLISGGNIKADKTKVFGEKECQSGSLGILLGNTLMELFIKLAKE